MRRAQMVRAVVLVDRVRQRSQGLMETLAGPVRLGTAVLKRQGRQGQTQAPAG